MPGRMVAQPGAEGAPDELWTGDGKVLKQPLTDDTRLDEDMVGVELAFDGIAVLGRRTVEMLVAVVATQRLHVGHPEMVREGTDQPDRLLEGVLDFEAQAVEANDVGCRQ